LTLPRAAALGAIHDRRPIEGTWWSGDDRLEFDLGDPANWRWTLAVPVPGAARTRAEPRAPMVETYVTDPTTAEPSQLVTRVEVAMAPAGEGDRA
jgi:hypothetical protein